MTFDWIVGFMTMVTWWMAGDDNWKAYLVGSVTQVCWIYYGIWILKSIPISTMAVLLWVILLRNMIKTRRRNERTSG